MLVPLEDVVGDVFCLNGTKEGETLCVDRYNSFRGGVDTAVL